MELKKCSGTDKKATFFVGDAAGRADDFASTDRKWAINIGIPFHTPEVSPYLLSSNEHSRDDHG